MPMQPERDKTIRYCKTCTKNKFDLKNGIVCSLTGKVADFEWTCPHYEKNTNPVKRVDEKKAQEMVGIGQKKLISFFIIMICLNIAAFILSVMTFKPLNGIEIIKLVLRISFQLGFFHLIYKGKYWAKILLIVLYAISIILALFIIPIAIYAPIAFVTIGLMLCAYIYAVYFLGYDKDFLVFFEHKNSQNRYWF